MRVKHFSALRVQFGGGYTAILFKDAKADNAFGTVVDKYDNPLNAVFVHFASAQRPSGQCSVYRFQKDSEREDDVIISSAECEVQARETSFIVPPAMAKEVNGLWKFGSNFFRTCLQFLYAYD